MSILHGLLYLSLFVFVSVSVQGQRNTRYSVDLNPPDKRRVPLEYFIEQTKTNFKEASELRKKRRINKKVSRKIQKHTYNNQTSAVKKRMRQSAKKADEFNDGKRSFKERIIKLCRHG
ncbi:MAG: hypothetical protein PHC38_12315 [Weeksellaceae bacterium]|nr:hypothetical protein [Weeksellaceae bacterium]